MMMKRIFDPHKNKRKSINHTYNGGKFKHFFTNLKKINYKNILFYRQGFLDAEMLRTVLHAHHVPLPDDLLRAGISM
jgi:hypothetical protein